MRYLLLCTALIGCIPAPGEGFSDDDLSAPRFVLDFPAEVDRNELEIVFSEADLQFLSTSDDEGLFAAKELDGRIHFSFDDQKGGEELCLQGEARFKQRGDDVGRIPAGHCFEDSYHMIDFDDPMYALEP